MTPMMVTSRPAIRTVRPTALAGVRNSLSAMSQPTTTTGRRPRMSTSVSPLPAATR